MSYGPGIGTLVGMAMAQVENNQDARNASLQALSQEVRDLEAGIQYDRAFTRAATLVLDEVLAEVAKVQSGELANAGRGISRATPEGRVLRNARYADLAAQALREQTGGKLALSRADRERVMAKLPLD